MSEEPHDDRHKFEQHPDIRGLGGPAVGQFSEVAETFNERTAAVAELLVESPCLVKLDDIPVGGILHVTSDGPDGQRQETEFVRTSSDRHGLSWAVRTPTPNGDFLEEPAALNGSRLGSAKLLYQGEVRQGTNLAYTIMHRMRGKSGADFPVGEGIMNWSSLTPVDKVNPKIAEENVRIGIMERLPDGSLQWVVPASTDEITTGLVTDARVVMPEAQELQ
ncbi:MAG TPA: hypothetical protein VJ836_01495 [Candidatus Saccharimonadales bacterium]|nr:hypothetical protein [Candidatus Saccharimonadales bacterium]